MRGTIISRVAKGRKKSFGYSFFAGRDENGKRIQKVKRGFATRAEAEEALRRAIADHQKPVMERTMPTFAEFFERWQKEVVRRDCKRKTSERYYELGQYA